MRVLDDLVLVLAVAAVIPLALASVPRPAVPAAVVEILAGIVLGPGTLARTLATTGLAFLLLPAGRETDVEESASARTSAALGAATAAPSVPARDGAST